MVAAEGEVWGLELGESVPLRVALMRDERLREGDAVCVVDRETTELRLKVAAPERVFETEDEAVCVVVPVLVRELVCESVGDDVSEEETETEGDSDHSELVDGYGEREYDAEELTEAEANAECVAELLNMAEGLCAAVGDGPAEKVAVSVRLRL